MLARADGQNAREQADREQPAKNGKKPNILIIMGDDIGIPQISAYTMGLMGYKTPNIDRIAREGALFTDSYGQQSCTAGRASFILGQELFRTGLLTIGVSPVSRCGLGRPTEGLDLVSSGVWPCRSSKRRPLPLQDGVNPCSHFRTPALPPAPLPVGN
jgi:hypothetical protein